MQKSTYLLINKEKPTIRQLPTNVKSNKSNLYVYFCSLVANLLLMTGGSMQVWLSPVLVQLKSNNTNINPLGAPLKTLQVSILAAIPDTSLFTGFIYFTIFANKLGRKQMMLYSAIAISLALTLIAFSKNIYVYYVFLFVVGFNLSVVFVNVPVYVAEIADAHNRAKIGCLVGLAMPSGVLITYVVGFYSGFTIFTIACALPVFIFLLTVCFIVESPVYFFLKNQIVNASQSLERLRNGKYSQELEKELAAIEQTIRVSNNRGIFELFKNKSTIKALFLSVIIAVGQQMSGILVILTFVATIFNDAGFDISGNIVGMIIGSIQLLIVLIITYIVENVGRRILLLASVFCCSVNMMCLSICFYLKEIDSDLLRQVNWLPVLILSLFIIGYGLGLGPIPMTLVTEMFPSDLRCSSVAIYFMTMAMTASCLNFGFPIFSELAGVYSCMLAHGIFSIFTFIVLFYSLPETRGKTLSEIQELLNDHLFSVCSERRNLLVVVESTNTTPSELIKGKY